MKKKKLSKQSALKQKLKDYKKILKNDEDWDWAYILRILKYKLERKRKCHNQRSCNIIVYGKKLTKCSKIIEIARKLKEMEHSLRALIKS